MLSINKQDIFKTILIIWLFAATGYFVVDQYKRYQARSMQMAYQQGYADSVGKLIEQTEKSGCQPFEVFKDDKKVQLVNGVCLTQQQPQQIIPSK